MTARARSIVEVAWKFVVKCTRRQGLAVALVGPSLEAHRIHIGWMREAPCTPVIAVPARSLTRVLRSRAEGAQRKSASLSAAHSEGGAFHAGGAKPWTWRRPAANEADFHFVTSARDLNTPV